MPNRSIREEGPQAPWSPRFPRLPHYPGSRNMSDYDDVIEVLEKKSATLKYQCDAVQRALVALRGADETPAPAPANAPRRTPKPRTSKKGKKGNRSAVKHFDWVKGRKMWDEGKTQAEIGDALGCTASGVYFRARTDGWPKRNLVKTRPAERPRIPVQKCPTCGAMTNVDPRERCHTA